MKITWFLTLMLALSGITHATASPSQTKASCFPGECPTYLPWEHPDCWRHDLPPPGIRCPIRCVEGVGSSSEPLDGACDLAGEAPNAHIGALSSEVALEKLAVTWDPDGGGCTDPDRWRRHRVPRTGDIDDRLRDPWSSNGHEQALFWHGPLWFQPATPLPPIPKDPNRRRSPLEDLA